MNVVEHLSLFGSQIVQPVLYNTLTLLKNITVIGREKVMIFKDTYFLFLKYNSKKQPKRKMHTYYRMGPY